jgi:hypothetical protein
MITEKYMPNLKKIILKPVIYSPADFEKRPTTSVYGTLSCGAVVPYQKSSMRPIPELGCYRMPIPNIYLSSYPLRDCFLVVHRYNIGLPRILICLGSWTEILVDSMFEAFWCFSTCLW